MFRAVMAWVKHDPAGRERFTADLLEQVRGEGEGGRGRGGEGWGEGGGRGGGVLVVQCLLLEFSGEILIVIKINSLPGKGTFMCPYTIGKNIQFI